MRRLPQRRASASASSFLNQYHSRTRPPTCGDKVDIAWDDRGEVFRGVISRRIARRRGARPAPFEFEVHYEDGDVAVHDLDAMRWRFAHTVKWYFPGDLADVKPPSHDEQHLQRGEYFQRKRRQQYIVEEKSDTNKFEEEKVLEKERKFVEKEEDTKGNDISKIENRGVDDSKQGKKRRRVALLFDDALSEQANSRAKCANIDGVVSPRAIAQFAMTSDAEPLPTQTHTPAIHTAVPNISLSISNADGSDPGSLTTSNSSTPLTSTLGHSPLSPSCVSPSTCESNDHLSDAWACLRDSSIPLRKRLNLARLHRPSTSSTLTSR